LALNRSALPAIAELFSRYQHSLRSESLYIAATFLAIIEPIRTFTKYSPNNEEEMIAKSINLFLHGAIQK
jgi:hypothetical protein